MRLLAIYLAITLSILNFKHNAESAETANDDTTYIAIMMGGGVSLGTYEAGVLAELMKQLQSHNEETGNKNKYFIDIMVGASAGSMTLGLVADQMYRGNSKIEADSLNSLYKAWVNDIDIRRLLPKSRKDLVKDPYVFDSTVLDSIANRLILNKPKKSENKPVNFAPNSLIIAMTLSNMNGLDYKIDFQQSLIKRIFFNTDTRYFRILKSGSVYLTDPTGTDIVSDVSVSWKDIINSAIASGSFPFAFKPREIIRYKKEYNEINVPLTLKSYGMAPYSYVDGGFFNNNPISLALNLARSVDNKREKKKFKRLFLYISPDEKLYKDNSFSEKTVENLDKYAVHIADMLYNTSNSQDNRYYLDYIQNSEEQREDNVKRYSILFTAAYEYYNTGSINKFWDIVEADKSLFFPEDHWLYDLNTNDLFKPVFGSFKSFKELVTLDVKEPLDEKSINQSILTLENIKSISKQYPVLLTGDKAKDNKSKDDILKMIYNKYIGIDNDIGKVIGIYLDNLLKPEKGKEFEAEKAKELFLKIESYIDYKEPPEIILVTNSIDKTLKLGSSGFGHFGGFLDKDIRKHDYKIGRYSIQKILSKNLKLEIKDELKRNDITKLREPLENFRNYVEDPKDRRHLRYRMNERLEAYMKHMKLKWYIRIPALASGYAYLNSHVYYENRALYLTLNELNVINPSKMDIGFNINPLIKFGNNIKPDLGNKMHFGNWLWWFTANKTFFSYKYNHDKNYHDYSGSVEVLFPKAKGLSFKSFLRIRPAFGRICSKENYKTYRYFSLSYTLLVFDAEMKWFYGDNKRDEYIGDQNKFDIGFRIPMWIFRRLF